MSSRWFWLVIVFVIAWLVQLLAPILTPFLIGMLLAYIGDPLVDRLELRFSRTFSVVTVFLTLIISLLIVILILVPSVERQIVYLFTRLPEYLAMLHQFLEPLLSKHLGIELGNLDINTVKQWLQTQFQQDKSNINVIMSLISSSGITLLNWAMNMVLIPVITFYMLRDWDILVAHIHDLIPRKYVGIISGLAKDSDLVISAFFRGQLMVMLALGVIYVIGLSIVGLELSLLLGMIAGIVSFVPYLGFIVGIVSAGIAAILQFHELMPVVYVAIVFGVGQMIEGMFLSPVLLGERIGLHPVAVIFAVMAGGQLFGFFGVLVALPVAAVIMVIMRYFHGHYKNSSLYTTPES